MESLDRNNYEIWFVDYLDGQLNNDQLDTFLDFLEQNPDLKEELTGISGITLNSGTETDGRKELLLKSRSDIPGIGSVDQLCIARMENDLTDEEARQFDIRLEKEPALAAVYSAFLHTRLNPSEKVVYPFKGDLRKKTVIFTPWLITAISAAAVILLVWILWPSQQQSLSPGLAGNVKPAAVDTQAPAGKNKPIMEGTRIAGNNHTAGPVKKISVPRHEKPEQVIAQPAQREIVPMKSLARKGTIAGPRIPDPQSTRILLASRNTAALVNPAKPEDALTVPQYALMMFREKILGQDRNMVRKTRFSIWEVAGAGVEKINSMAGTEMKLNRQYDSKGDILAVSFNSRLLDVEAPVHGQENK